MDASVVWSAVSAVGSVAAAAVAAWAARQSSNSAREANAAAAQASAAAAALVAIERDRRHDELTPEFDVSCTLQRPDSDMARMHVALRPGRLDRLDEVTITILDEAGTDHWAYGVPDGVSQEEAEAFVWGLWEFNTGASLQVVSNRTTRPRAYSVVSGKNWEVLSMRATRPGHWMDGTSPEDWRRQHKGKPIRLLFTCRREGYEQWSVPCDVYPDVVKVARIRYVD